MIKDIIFDWSGTLSDDVILVYKAAMIIFRTYSMKEISFDEFKKEFTLPYMNFYKKYKPDMTKEQVCRVFGKAIYEVGEPEPFPGVKETIKKLYDLGINMVVLSSVPQLKLEKEVKAYGISKYFKEMNGAVYDKVEVIHEILSRNNFNPDKTAYVGDMIHDIEAGKKAKVKIIAVTYGYQPEEKLKQLNPDHIINDISEIRQLL